MAGAAAAPEAPKQPAAAKEGAKPSAGEEKEPPPPDTRTWLQKNWIFMVPVVMIVRPHDGMHGTQAKRIQMLFAYLCCNL